jgi:arsenate reductase-like glutaredoxin family protein
MRSDKFITYLKNYMDPESVNSIIGTLGEHGTYWYFERQSKVLKRLSAATKKNDLTKIGSELLKQKANIERQIAGSSDNFQHRPLPNSEGFEPENIKPPGT